MNEVNNQVVSEGDSNDDKTQDQASLMAKDVTSIELDDKVVTLIGTAHISKESVDTVLQFLGDNRPDTVCVELDEARFKAVRQEEKWEDFDLIRILKEGKTTFLIAKLALTAFQRNMGSYTGVKPGSEMIAAMDKAESIDANVELIDRDISITLLRAWRMTPFFQKTKLIAALLASSFQKSEVSEEELADLRQEDNLSEMMEALASEMPHAKTAILDERDAFMAEKIFESSGKNVAVVIGAAHKPGIERRLREGIRTDLSEIDSVPPKTFLSKALPWILPLVIIGIMAAGFLFGDVTKAKEAAIAWVVVNAIGGGLGALIALAHPITIVVSMIAAPITSLNPTVGVGMVAGIVQTWLVPPKVSDLERIGDDFSSLTSIWKNRLGRVLLVFVTSSLGSSIATLVAFKWLIPLFGL